MTLTVKLTLIVTLILSIILPFGYYLIGEKNKKRYKKAIGVNIFFYFGAFVIAGIMMFGGSADAVLRRGVRTGVCPGKYAVVDLHRAGDAPGLDAGTVSGQPVSVWRSLPAVPAAAGTCRVAGGADRLGSDGPDSPDLAPDGGVADGHPHRSVLPAGRGRDYSVPFGTALLLPAPDGRRRLLCSPLSTSRKPMGSSPLWRTFP